MSSAQTTSEPAPSSENSVPQQAQADPAGSLAKLWCRWSGVALAALVLLSLFGPLALSGLWDPHELRNAELARRISVARLGAEHLVVNGMANDIPTVEEVGRGGLPYHLAAFSLRIFGLHGWAARLPMALAGLLAVVSIYWSTQRLAGLRIARLTVLILATTPLFFIQSRTFLGDAVTFAAVAGSFTLLAVGCFDPGLDGRRGVFARVGLLAGALLLMAAGIWCRGVLVGAAVPSLAVGLAAVLLPAPLKGRRFFGYGVFALGLGLSVIGVLSAWLATDHAYWISLGSEVDPGKQFWTHDQVIHYLGHGLFPWSALAPAAVGAAFQARDEEDDRTSAFRLALLLCLMLGIGAHTLVAQKAGHVPFAPVFAIAALLALGVVQWDRRSAGAPILAMVTAAFVVLLFVDFRHFPEKGLSAFAVSGGAFPESFEKLAGRLLLSSTFVSAAVFAALALERIGFLRTAFLWLKPNRWDLRRSSVVVATLGVFGSVLSFVYYPALAQQLSPMNAFTAYERLSKSGEPLATVGKEGSASAYYGNASVQHFGSEKQAIEWLVEEDQQRRWLVLKAAELAKMNSLFRRRDGRNLPVLDASSSEILLVSNQLGTEENRNRFMQWLPEEPPSVSHPMDVEYESRLRLLGWEIRDKKTGNATDELRTGQPYEFRMAYEVLSKVTKQWQTFIHIDGQGKRFNGDHDTLEKKYPFRLWNKGDYVVDSFPFELESTYSEGEYHVYFGLFTGKTRFKVSKGDHSDNRVEGGVVRVVAP